MTKPANLEVSTSDMAEVLNISARRLQYLAAEGWIEGRIARGKWELGKTVRSYFMHLALNRSAGSDPSYQ